jgi:hypothetical protein
VKIAEYPRRKCREAIWNGEVVHSCDLPDGHAGPPAAQSWPASVERRDAWEAEHPAEATAKDDSVIWADPPDRARPPGRD